MNENKAVPNIRFNDFENKWEKKKLNQIVKKITRKNSKLQTSLSLTISAERGIINQNLFFNRQIASRDMSNYFLIKQGEFAYNKSYSKSAPFGTIKRLNRYNQGALSSLYIVFCPTKVNSDYLVSYFDSSYWYKQLSMISTEGVRNHGLLNVSPNDFFDMNLSIPYDDKEQQKIGDFFSKLDKLLDLQQQKIDKLELLKKTLLQKLFPKHDAQIPELRFKGFEDDWQEKKLSHVVDIIMGQSPSSTNYYDTPIENSMILIQGNADIKHHNVKPRIWTTQITKIAIPKDVLLTVRAPVGEVAKNKYEAVIGRGMAALRGNDFLYYNLEKLKEVGYWERLSTGSTFESISSNDIRDTKIKIPSCKEQKKVYNLLSKVDQLIELENKKLQNFQQVKKCLLQNMFVE